MTNKHSTNPRGRPKRSKVDEFQAMAWFNTIAHRFDINSPFQLERLIEPNHVKRNADGKLVCSRAWDKYKKGKRLPKDGMKPDGTPGAVLLAGERVPESADIYRHPIWKILRAEHISLDEAKTIVYGFRDYVRRFYFDLELPDLRSRLESFGEFVCLPIHIGADDDLIVSLDHLAINLMLLKMERLLPAGEWYPGIKENIEMTLGPLSVSPWIGPFHEEFFEWLKKNL